MLNYSEAQYTEDRAAIKSKAKKALDEKMTVWIKLSKKCKTSHIINPLPSQKLAAASYRKAEKSQAESIAKLVSKNTLTKEGLKDYDSNHETETQKERD